MSTEPQPTTDIELAAQLGTDRKSLRRWRSQFGSRCPQERNVSAWDRFLRANCLGPYSARMGYGESKDADQSVSKPPTGVSRRDLRLLRDPVERVSFTLSYVELLLGGIRVAPDTFPKSAREEANQAFGVIREQIEKLYKLAGVPDVTKEDFED